LTNLRKVFRRFSRRSSQRQSFIGLAVLLFAAVGILALYAAQADTFVQTAEAEDGVVAGNAEKKDAQGGASGGSVLFGATTNPPGPPPLPFPSKTGAITSGLSGLCLDIQDGVASENTPIRTWSCNGAPAQTWTIQYTKYGASEIKALGQCLTTPLPSVTTYRNVYLSPCSGSFTQLWMPSGENTSILSYISINTSSAGDLCLDVSGSNPAAGARIGTWTCSRNDAQNWSVPASSPAGAGYFQPFHTNVNKCMDLPNGSPTPGIQLQVWDCNQQPAQYLGIGIESGPGSRARLTLMGRCLETRDGGTADGTPVQTGNCSDSAAQDWTYMRHGSALGFKHRISEKCIDTESGQIANSTKLVIKTCNPSAPGQQFGR
jgi:hypothetical protein